jgi:hypothetical protein
MKRPLCWGTMGKLRNEADGGQVVVEYVVSCGYVQYSD